jgi:pyruvate/2-oxoglutarate dehydrogenase complex dihydrolipoamide acyltransferase (E2) component
MAKLEGWRKIASAMWGPPDDPQIYGALEFDATPLLELMDKAKAQGHRITVTHLVGRSIALALAAVPDFNVRIVGSKMIPRDSVDIFYITAVEGGRSLSGVRIDNTDKKSVFEVARELSARATRMKQGDDPEFAKTKSMMDGLPKPVLKVAMRFSAWVSGDRNKSIKALGVKANTFGSAMVTSVGMFGIPQGFAPLARFYRMPLLILVGEIADKPVAVDGKVKVLPMLPITATIDHRYADGWHISQLIKPFKAYFADPRAFEPDPSTIEAPERPAPGPGSEPEPAVRPKRSRAKAATK